MNWMVLLVAFFSGLLILMTLRIPVAIAMLSINLLVAIFLFDFAPALRLMSGAMYRGMTSFLLVPVPLFILMGEILFRCGVATRALGALNALLRRVPSRLTLVATGSGTLLGLLSGSTIANTAVLGATLLPEMREKGYSKHLSMGSILASGGLAMIIPPSALAVLWAAIANVPVGPLLIAGLIPGLLMAVGYGVINIVWGLLGGAPPNDVQERLPARVVASIVVRDLLPLGIIVVLVIGTIFYGIATPSESAAFGVVGAMTLALTMGDRSVRSLIVALRRAIEVSGMLFFLVLAAQLFSQIMSFTGATTGFVSFFLAFGGSEYALLALMLAIVLFLGLFLEQVSIMLVTAPFFMPLVALQGWDPVWFSIVILIALQIALTTPPFGMSLFVMKAAAPPDTRLVDVYKSVVPYVASDILVIVVIVAFPILVTVLPRLM